MRLRSAQLASRKEELDVLGEEHSAIDRYA
jgi:hypothetical protein